ncbi:MAG TPA: L-histidine N(alpha)-methyltransferase [Bryobacteraceae bacterium]|nr:L-histidine N(alpha)-methyltransferase [Bryobacteraceae bacterium]
MAISAAVAEFGLDVRAGLLKHGQKELHSKYLYDDLGSALFEAITFLPEYGLTRADERLLESHSGEIVSALPPPVRVAELGSGSGRKTRLILEALQSRQESTDYHPIDVSAAALSRCRYDLSAIADVHPVHASYLDGLEDVVGLREPWERLLVLFLGSNIGNFERSCGIDFLRRLRRSLRTGDALLMGADLVKPAPRLISAYDDPTGVTAAFNLNLLARINRELDADFDLRQWEHAALYNGAEKRIEMHLRSRAPQAVTIPGADLSVTFHAGETIWTESSHKFTLSDLDRVARQTGFAPEAVWTDREWPFAESLWIAS